MNRLCPPGPPQTLRDGVLEWHRLEREILGVSFERRLLPDETISDPVVSAWRWTGVLWLDQSSLWLPPQAQVADPEIGRVGWFWEAAGDGPFGGGEWAFGVMVSTSSDRRLYAHPRLAILDVASA